MYTKYLDEISTEKLIENLQRLGVELSEDQKRQLCYNDRTFLYTFKAEKEKHPDMLPYNELKEEVKEYDRATVRAVLQAQKELQSKYNYNNLKSFDLEAAKAGKPVCTRDGRKARIICFDRRDKFSHIVALITNPDGREIIWGYEDSGACLNDNKNNDLMMLPEKKEGWVNIYALNTCYSSKEEAEANIDQDYEHEYVRTVKIEWEE